MALISAVLLPALGWWLLVTLIGLAAAPISVRLFDQQLDRGLSFARPLGILLVGYFYWLGASFRLFTTGRGAAVLLVLVLGCLGLFIVGRPSGLGGWIRDRWRPVVAGELLFLLVFLGWAVVRAYDPEIAGTEKPMELTFLNGVLRSEYFPPNDPWLSGHSISYYYFGYVLLGMLAKLAGTPASIAFNLSVALVMAMAAHGAFGLVSGLVASRGSGSRTGWLAAGLFGAFALVGLGNLVGVLDFLISHNIGSLAFWQWVQIDGLKQPYQSASWYPSEHWWWWKSTRVINTFVNGQGIDYTITEFPNFSFVLADLHPHVIALPFDILVLGIALAAALSPVSWASKAFVGRPWLALVVAIALGSLGFLNSWDLPTYAAVLIAVVAIRAYREAGSLSRQMMVGAGLFVITIGLLAIVFYLPFYLRFQSQASGIRAVQTAATQWRHFLFFWAPVASLAVSFVIWRLRTGLEAGWRVIVPAAATFGLAPLAAWLSIVLAASARPENEALIGLVWSKVAISLPLGCIVAGASILAGRATQLQDRLVAIVAGTAFLLILGAEHFFILDVFGSRMNTVFKLYYQAWTLLAIASAYGLYCLWPRRVVVSFRTVSLFISGLLVLAGTYFPLAATYSKTDGFQGTPTLDGLEFARQANPDEAAAIGWLASNAVGAPVVVEATGGQYSEFGRVSTRTGLPTILGWAGHERQWRGSDEAFRGREQAIDRIYSGGSREELASLLRQFNVTYVYVGPLERQKYGQAAGERLSTVLDPAFQNSSVTVFRVR